MTTAKVNGVKIAYELRGSGEPLLLLMGLGAPGSAWEPHVKAFERSFKCIVMDNRGAGASGKPEGPFSAATMADDAAVLLDSLGIESALVAGISMGSGIAQELALRHPGKARRMALVSSWSRCDEYMKQLFQSFSLARSRLSPQAFVRMLQLWIWTPSHFSSHFKEMEEAAAGAGENPMPAQAFDAQCQACLSHDSFDRLGKIQQPCLLTAGDADIFTPLRLSEEMHARLPDSRLEVFRGMGHCHHWEDLERFNRTVANFLLGK